MAIEPRVNLITLAVTDIARATAFYRSAGLVVVVGEHARRSRSST